MVLELVTARCPKLAGYGTPGAVVCQLVGEAKVQGIPGLVPATGGQSAVPRSLAVGPLESWLWCRPTGVLEDRARPLGVAVGSGFLKAAGLLVGGAGPCLTSCLA